MNVFSCQMFKRPNKEKESSSNGPIKQFWQNNCRILHESIVGHRSKWRHRLHLLVKLDKQIGGTIHWPFLATIEALGLVGVGAVHMPRWVQNSTSKWLSDCLSSFANRRQWWRRRHRYGPSTLQFYLKSLKVTFDQKWGANSLNDDLMQSFSKFLMTFTCLHFPAKSLKR